MGQDDIAINQHSTIHDPRPDTRSSAGTVVSGGENRQGEPLFKRFGVSKEWRAKDNGVG
jgi:hypothetical protein